jgi:hypothetical protein
LETHRLTIKCKACNQGHVIIGDCATECSVCGASIDMDTGEPFRYSNGDIVYCITFGGKNFVGGK